MSLNIRAGPPLYSVGDSELIAVMRRDRAKAEAFAERHGAKRVYTDIDALLADDELNAIYVATPPYLHCEQTIRVAETEKHVLCEKPMAMTVEECHAWWMLPRCGCDLDARLLPELLSEHREDEGVDGRRCRRGRGACKDQSYRFL